MSEIIKARAIPSIYGAIIKVGNRRIIADNGLNHRIPPYATTAVFVDDNKNYQVVGRQR